MAQTRADVLPTNTPAAPFDAATTLLIVDDHPAGRYVKSRILAEAGFHVLEATTGQDALRMVAKHCPALVVLDIQLPDLDGVSVCRALKQDPATANIMVLQFSAYHTSTDNQVEGLDSGADSYIPGDVAPVLLVAVVRALLRTRRVEEALRERQERLQLAEALNRSQEGFRSLAAALLTAQEEERRRVARELHDDLAQQLAVLEMQLTLRRQQSSGPDIHLDAALACVAAVSETVRKISHRLHPDILEQLGLETALRSLCEEWERMHGLPIRCLCPTAPLSIPLPVATVLYRIAQEALRNVVKHAGDARVTVILSKTKQNLRLHIQDDGCGFDSDALRHRAGLGLISMQERVRLVGGSLALRSVPGRGTEVEADIPWSE